MPLITAPFITPEEPPVVPPVEIPGVGYAAITYVDPTGRRWPMTDTSLEWYALAEGVSGLGAVTYTLTSDPHPRGGARLRHVQPQPRTIVWPVLVKGADHMVFTDNWRALGVAFTRTLRDGPGTLEVARPDGRVRRIPVYYSEGWDGRGQAATGITWDSAVVTLWCEDPYWVDAVPLHIHREAGAGADFLVPFPTVSSSQVLGETVVTNPGDAEVWPEWVVTGPASLITFTREDTGDSFVLDPTATAHGALLAGEQVTISTDPPRVRYQDGSPDGINWIGALNWPEASLWSLPPGDTAVAFQLDGATTGSAVDLTFHPRYEMA
ncbi:phage tail protein [Streptomyces sp. NPDC020755]|uniref:phage tail protein n=1 Tax=Streptomyces sp. NPDC020755 TaxID=3154790 RepID=UPI0034021567